MFSFFFPKKKSTILINQDGRALLTDFASSSITWTYQDASKHAARWCAPEVLGDNPLSGTRPTFASDVFSFGMVVFEVTPSSLNGPVSNERELGLNPLLPRSFQGGYPSMEFLMTRWSSEYVLANGLVDPQGRSTLDYPTPCGR